MFVDVRLFSIQFVSLLGKMCSDNDSGDCPIVS